MRQHKTAARRLIGGLSAIIAIALPMSACGDDSSTTGEDPTAPTDFTKDTGTATVRLGVFPNITHAPGLIGIEKGYFGSALGTTRLDVKAFNAGPEAIEAIFADALDVAYVGPNPAINAWAKSHGEAVNIISGSTSGGAALVTKPEITSAKNLKGKVLSTPQLGGTQDVALRNWLKTQGLSTDTSGGGDVSIKPQPNGDTLTAFKAGDIDGAWVPEPFVSRMVLEGGGKVLVDEASLWPDGKFITTNIIVRKAFLKEHPDAVVKVLSGHLKALDLIASDPAAAQKAANDRIATISGKPLSDEVLDSAWKNLTFGVNPLTEQLGKVAKSAQSIGLLDKVDLDGIYDLAALNQALKDAGKPEVS